MSYPHDDDGIGIELGAKVIPLSSIIPLKMVQPATKQSRKYLQIVASIRAVGLEEFVSTLAQPSLRPARDLSNSIYTASHQLGSPHAKPSHAIALQGFEIERETKVSRSMM